MDKKLRVLMGGVESYSHEIEGECKCGIKIIMVMDSNLSIWKDRIRYNYPDDNTTANIFRCRNCGDVIRESFIKK